MPKPALLIPVVAAALLLTGCVSNAPVDAEATVVAVESTAEACIVDTDTVASGPVTFTVTNSGDGVTEFYLLGDDGLSIVSEVENIAPGSSRELTVVVPPGDYFTVCKPGMIGEGIGKAPFTVTGDAVAVAEDEANALPPGVRPGGFIGEAPFA